MKGRENSNEELAGSQDLTMTTTKGFKEPSVPEYVGVCPHSIQMILHTNYVRLNCAVFYIFVLSELLACISSITKPM